MITQIQSPSLYASAHQPTFFTVTSDQKAQPNFKYVFDVYVAASLVARIKVFPEPKYGYGMLDVSKIIQSYLSGSYFAPAPIVISAPATEGSFKVSYQVRFGEEYGVPLTTYLNLVTSPTHVAYNYYNDLLSIDYSDLSEYVDKFLTTRPRPVVQRMAHDAYAYIHFFNPTMQDRTFTYTAYNGQHQLLDQITPMSNGELIQLGIGPKNITAWDFETEGIAYYTIAYGSELMTIVPTATPYLTYSLVFMNRLGGYETVAVNMKSSRSVNMQRKTYGSNPFSIGADGQVSPFAANSVLLGNQNTYAIQQQHSFKLSTAPLSEFEWSWLTELIASPVVYLQLSKRNTGSSGNLESGFGTINHLPASRLGTSVYHYPVKVRQDNYEMKKSWNAPACLELEVELCSNQNSQSF
jgi:hypothetical protein